MDWSLSLCGLSGRAINQPIWGGPFYHDTTHTQIFAAGDAFKLATMW